MPEIVLTEEQARILAGAGTTTVVVRGPDGGAVGTLDPQVAFALARARQRAANPSPWVYPSAAVTAMLGALQAERDRIGPFDAAYAHEFVRRLEESDPETYGPKERG